MNEITLEAYAKINLGLDVLRKREDGYHEVDMIMQTLTLQDTLTLKKIEEDTVVLRSADGKEIPDVPLDASNLISKVITSLREEFGIKEGVEAILTKRIPVAAGMAGGSTDAAAAYRGINALFDLGLDTEELCKRAVAFGADIPYCIKGGTARSQGIGEILTPLPDMPACYILVAKPEVNVSTGFVYGNLHADTLENHPDIEGMAEAIRQANLSGIVDRLGNVLETVTIPAHPIIEEIKDSCMDDGALGALMSGSGSTVFAIFDRRDLAEAAAAGIAHKGLAKQIFVTEPIGDYEAE